MRLLRALVTLCALASCDRVFDLTRPPAPAAPPIQLALDAFVRDHIKEFPSIGRSAK